MNQTEKKDLLALLPNELQKSKEFTNNFKLILAYFIKMNGLDNSIKTGQFFITNDTLAKELKVSTKTINIVVNKLSSLTFITRKTGRRGHASEYILNVEAINSYKNTNTNTVSVSTNKGNGNDNKILNKLIKKIDELSNRITELEAFIKENTVSVSNKNEEMEMTDTDIESDIEKEKNILLNNINKNILINKNNINKNILKEKENINTNIEEKEKVETTPIIHLNKKEVEVVETRSLNQKSKEYIQFNNIFYDNELNKINKLTSTDSVLAAHNRLKQYISSTDLDKNTKIKLVEGLEKIVNARCATIKSSETTSKELSSKNDTTIPIAEENAGNSLKIAKEQALKEKRLNYFQKLNKDCQIFKEAATVEILEKMVENLLSTLEFIDEVNKEEIKNFIFKRYNQIKESLQESNTDDLKPFNASNDTSVPNNTESAGNGLKTASIEGIETYDKDKNAKIKNMYADFTKSIKNVQEAARKKWLMESEIKGTLDSLMFNLQTKTDNGNMDKFKYCQEHLDTIKEIGLENMFNDVKKLMEKPAIP